MWERNGKRNRLRSRPPFHIKAQINFNLSGVVMLAFICVHELKTIRQQYIFCEPFSSKAFHFVSQGKAYSASFELFFFHLTKKKPCHLIPWIILWLAKLHKVGLNNHLFFDELTLHSVTERVWWWITLKYLWAAYFYVTLAHVAEDRKSKKAFRMFLMPNLCRVCCHWTCSVTSLLSDWHFLWPFLLDNINFGHGDAHTLAR